MTKSKAIHNAVKARMISGKKYGTDKMHKAVKGKKCP